MADKAEIPKNENPPKHPGWETFLQHYRPATKGLSEYLTTSDILERINTIVLADYYPEESIFNDLKEAGFNQVRIGDLMLWPVSQK